MASFVDVALAIMIALIAVAFLGTWYYALWRGWRHALKGHPPTERRILISGLAALLLLPVGLAVVGASDDAAMIAIVIAMAVVLPVLTIIGAREHRRRERRIEARRHGPSDGDD